MRAFKRIFLTVAILVIIAFVADYTFLKPLIERKLRQTLQNIDDKQIDFADVRSRLITGTVKISDVFISSMKSAGDSSGMKITMDEIVFSGINIIRAIIRDDIRIYKVKMTGFRMYANDPFNSENTDHIVADRNIHIGRFEVETDTIILKEKGKIGEYLITAANLNLLDINILTDDTISLNHAGTISFQIPEFRLEFSNGYNSCLFYGARYDSGMINIDSFHYRPNYRSYAYTDRFEFETDRIEANLKDISVQDAGIREWLKGNLVCSNMIVKKMDLNVFRDKRKNATHVTRKAFQEIIREYPRRLSVDSICVLGGRIVYSEHVDDATRAGYISLDDVNFRIFNITNNSKLRSSGISLSVYTNARLMNDSSLLKVELKAPLFDTNNAMLVKGSMGKFQIERLNPLLTNQIFAKARGSVDSLHFRFVADNRRAIGDLIMIYKDLQITSIENERNDSTAIRERIKSAIANFKVSNSNPLPGQPLRIGSIRYERDPKKFLVNYSFKSVLSGIKSTILVNPPVNSQD